MYSAVEVAKFIISYCTDMGNPISNLKLQKILYFLQVYYVRNNGWLFPEEIYAWQHGPVVPEVYYMFSGYGAAKIRNRYSTEIDYGTQEHLLPIIERLRNINPWELVDMTHVENGPWDLVYNKGFNIAGIIERQLLLQDNTDLGV